MGAWCSLSQWAQPKWTPPTQILTGHFCKNIPLNTRLVSVSLNALVPGLQHSTTQSRCFALEWDTDVTCMLVCYLSFIFYRKGISSLGVAMPLYWQTNTTQTSLFIIMALIHVTQLRIQTQWPEACRLKYMKSWLQRLKKNSVKNQIKHVDTLACMRVIHIPALH